MSGFNVAGKRGQRFAKAMNKNKRIAKRQRHINTRPSACTNSMELASQYAGQAIAPIATEYAKAGNSDRTGAGTPVFKNRSMCNDAMDLNYRASDSTRPEHYTPQSL